MVRAEPRCGDNGDARVVTESFLRPLDSSPLKRARQIETETETDRERERERYRAGQTERQRLRRTDMETDSGGSTLGRGQGRINQWAHWALAQGSPIFLCFLRNPQLAVVKYIFKN